MFITFAIPFVTFHTSSIHYRRLKLGLITLRYKSEYSIRKWYWEHYNELHTYKYWDIDSLTILTISELSKDIDVAQFVMKCSEAEGLDNWLTKKIPAIFMSK